jgi:hypothetical protein
MCYLLGLNQQMNKKGRELCIITKNAFGKHIFILSTKNYTF